MGTQHLVEDIPGIAEAGWTSAEFMGILSRETDRDWSTLIGQLRNIWREVEKHDASWPFREPVDTEEVQDYLTIIKDPIDLSKIKERLDADHYKSKEMLKADMDRMIQNCKIYNDQKAVFYKEAERLGAFIERILSTQQMKR